MTIQKDSLFRLDECEEIYDHLVQSISRYAPDFSEAEKQKMKKALDFLSRTTPETFDQRIYILNILLKIYPDMDTILACLFIPLDGFEIAQENILKYAGNDALSLLTEVIRVSTILYQGPKNSDVIRRYLLSQVDDIRVIYIRIAKRIGLLQKIFYGDLIVSDRKKERYIKGALAIGVPLLAELGVYSLKSLLEDVCFGLKYPEKLQEIKDNLDRTKAAREKIIAYIEDEISVLLEMRNIPFLEIKGRNKGFASIAKKIEKKEYRSLEEVTDVLAIRIIVETEEDCYAVLSELHAHKEFIESHFNDYIASPKLNGYQSLHTILVGLLDDDTPVEIQIRSREMDIHAEMGAASHLSYKGGKSVLKNKNIVNIESTLDRAGRFRQIKKNLPEKIYPMTPTGEIKELPVGSTPVDFAYSIHSDVGDHCSGAIVNEKIFPLNASLKTGDMVGILTDKNKKPNAAWLDFVVSHSAKQKIRLFLNVHADEFFLPSSYSKKEENHNDEKTAEYIKKKEQRKKQLAEARQLLKKSSPERNKEIEIGGEKGIPHHFAKCCCPQENPSIVAYSSSTRDFVIHSQSCHNLLALDKNRLVDARWKEEDSDTQKS